MDPCSTCRFWVATDWQAGPPPDPEVDKVPIWGQCRHKSPVVVSRPNGVATEFPRTSADCGCGDHKDRLPDEQLESP